MGVACSRGANEKPKVYTALPSAAHCRPPLMDAEDPVPDTERGPYAWERYHANTAGLGAGFYGTVEESQEAYDRFQDACEQFLTRAGPGKTGDGDWRKLAASGGLLEIDISYLQTNGFANVGGEGFTLDNGLRWHVERFSRRLRHDYDAAYRGMSPQEQETLEALAAKYPSTDRAWDVEQRLDDRSSVLELYARSTGAARTLWDVMVGVAEAAGLKPTNATATSLREGNGASNTGGQNKVPPFGEALSWHVKLLSERLRVKAAKYGGIHQVTDVLRGSIVFDTAEQLSRGMDFLFLGDVPVVWVKSRLAEDSLFGYRDVLLLLELHKQNPQERVVCELQLHLKVFFDRRVNGHAAYAVARLLTENVEALNAETYVGERNAEGQYHGAGKLTWPNGDQYLGAFKNGSKHGRGVATFADGESYDGQYENDKKHGTGKFNFADGNIYEGEYFHGTRHGSGVFKWAEGHTYVGNFVDDAMEGEGTFTYAGGDVYQGEFQNGMQWGMGTMQFANGDLYKGEWHMQQFSGQGRFEYGKDGECYIGEFKRGKRHGRGRFTLADGDAFDCTWLNGKESGERKWVTSKHGHKQHTPRRKASSRNQPYYKDPFSTQSPESTLSSSSTLSPQSPLSPENSIASSPEMTPSSLASVRARKAVPVVRKPAVPSKKALSRLARRKESQSRSRGDSPLDISVVVTESPSSLNSQEPKAVFEPHGEVSPQLSTKNKFRKKKHQPRQLLSRRSSKLPASQPTAPEKNTLELGSGTNAESLVEAQHISIAIDSEEGTLF